MQLNDKQFKKLLHDLSKGLDEMDLILDRLGRNIDAKENKDESRRTIIRERVHGNA